MKLFSKTGLFVCGMVIIASSTSHGETISEAVDQVIQTNPQVRSQVYNRLARDQEVVQAKSGYFPTLDINGAAGWAEHREPEDESLNPYEATISLRQNVFRGFADQGEIARQEARVKSSAYALQGTSENLALNASRAYLDVLRNEELKKVAEENLEIHLRIADQIKLRGDSGVGSQADTEQIQGRVSLAQSNVVVAETNLQDAESGYLAVIGHLPDSLVKPAAPLNLMPGSLDEATLLAIGSNPILKAAGADLEARQQQYEVAKAPYYPILDIEVDQRWDDEISRVEGERDYLLALGRVRYNLFNGWRDEGRKAETLELVNEAREIKNNTERQVVESMRLSWMAYMSVLDRTDYLRNYIKASTTSARAYAKQFDIGKRSLLDVLDAEAEAVNARIDLINAEYDGLYSQYRILAATGGLVSAFGLQWPEEAQVEEDE